MSAGGRPLHHPLRGWSPSPRVARWRSLELLPHHLLALGPERFRTVGVEGVGADAAAGGWVVVGFGDVAVLAVLAADLVGSRDEAGPDAGGGALRDRLPAEGGGGSAGRLLRVLDALDHRGGGL